MSEMKPERTNGNECRTPSSGVSRHRADHGESKAKPDKPEIVDGKIEYHAPPMGFFAFVRAEWQASGKRKKAVSRSENRSAGGRPGHAEPSKPAPQTTGDASVKTEKDSFPGGRVEGEQRAAGARKSNRAEAPRTESRSSRVSTRQAGKGGTPPEAYAWRFKTRKSFAVSRKPICLSVKARTVSEWLFKAVIIASACLLVLDGLLVIGELMTVKQVTVTGGERYSNSQLEEIADVRPNDRLWSISRSELTARIKRQCPLVDKVSLRIWPGRRVNIKVTEKKHLYYTCHYENYYLIDADTLEVLAVDSSGTEYAAYGAIGLGLPEETYVRVGEKLAFVYLPYPLEGEGNEASTYSVETGEPEDYYEYVFRFISTITDSSLKDTAATIDAENRYQLSVGLRGGVRILFGKADDTDKKIDAAVRLIEKMKDDGRWNESEAGIAGYVIDVSDYRSPSVRTTQ